MDFETFRRFARKKKLRSDDGHLLKRQNLMTASPLEPKNDRMDEIALYQQMMEQLMKPKQAQAMPFGMPRKLTISIDI